LDENADDRVVAQTQADGHCVEEDVELENIGEEEAEVIEHFSEEVP